MTFQCDFVTFQCEYDRIGKGFFPRFLLSPPAYRWGCDCGAPAGQSPRSSAVDLRTSLVRPCQVLLLPLVVVVLPLVVVVLLLVLVEAEASLSCAVFGK